MSLLDVLKQYIDPAAAPSGDLIADHFDEVAKEVSPDDLGSGIAAAFRSHATPPFGQMVAGLFDRSNPQQQAGLLNQILASLGPGALSSLTGGALGASVAGAASINQEQASRLTPPQVSDITTHAEREDGSIVDRIGAFYAQHPALVKSLGAAALGIAMGHMGRRP